MLSRSLGITLLFVGVVACQAVHSPDSVSPDQLGVPRFTEQERALILADSELFEGVVRAQLAGTEKDYPYHLDSPRFDARPYGTDSAFPEYGLTFEKGDSAFVARLRQEVIARLVTNRKLILSALAVQEGGPRKYGPCAGILIPPAPPNDSAGRAKLAELRAGCPKMGDSYLIVSLPIHGVPAGILRLAGHYKQKMPSDGEIWTALIEGRFAGPSGSMWSEHAWVFQRNPSTRRLGLATTTLIGIAE